MDSYFSKVYNITNDEASVSKIDNFLSFDKLKKILILLFTLVILLIITIVNINKTKPLNYNSIALTGDSYASYLYNRLNGNLDCALESYFAAGQTIIENKELMLSAMKSSSKYVIISIGVNDHFKSTNLQLFHDTLDEIIKEGVKNNKIIFTHSFLEYPISKHFISMHTTHDYDNIIHAISDNYNEVTYININEYSKDKYFIDDNLHLNNEFYNKFFGILLYEFDKMKINIR